MEVTRKQCTKCKTTKPLDQFHKNIRTKDGKRPDCKACVKAKVPSTNTRWRKMIEETGTAWCTKCEAVFPKNEFDRALPSAPRVRTVCRECERATSREWHADNREWASEYWSTYYADNREKVLARAAERQKINPHLGWESQYRVRANRYGVEPVVERFTRDELITHWGNACWNCGGPFEELDHAIVPVAHGGAHSLENCRPSCTPCNQLGTGVRRLTKADVEETA